MSSYFDDASLVMIPSGYKTSKVYSVKPTDGTGDLAFTRSNDTATRVASNGLIEKVRTNLLTYSNDFSNAAWSKYNLTLTSGQTDPNGGTTAFLIQSTSAAAPNFGQVNAAAARTTSIFAKVGTRSNFSILNGTYNNGAQFDLSTQTATAFGVGSLAKIESVGSGWFRCEVFLSSTTETQVMLTDIAGNGGVIGDNLTFAFAQSETGDIATDYIATTTAAVSVGPVANVPRLDYLNSSCPRLLLEPQRTNLFTFSEQINNAAWLNAGGTTTANTAVSPSGYQDADTLTGVRYQATFASNTYTLSAFAKKVDGDNTFVLRFDAPTTKVAVFNLNNGTIVSTDAGYTSTITAYGNGWYRCTFTSPASTTISNAVFVSANAGVSSTYVWGAQLEVGAYATSYIPTLGASVTRGADTYQKGGFGNTSTAGTLYYEFEATKIDSPNGQYLIQLFAGSSVGGAFFADANAITITGNGPQIQGYNNSYSQLLFVSTPAIGATVKVALRYDGTNVVAFVNGVKGTVFADGSVGAKNAIRVNNGENGAQATKQLLFFPTALSDAQCIELTA